MAQAHNVVLLTGASEGIGAAAAKLLSANGFRVFGTSRHADAEPPAPAVEMLRLDVNDDASVNECVATAIGRAGRLDVLVNNAGYSHRGPLENVTVDEFRAQFETNLYGVHRMVRAVLPQLFSQGAGRIVNISSAIGRRAIPFAATYCASKFALEGYSEGLAAELRPLGISVVIMEPGLTATRFHANSTHTETVAERYQELIASRRMGHGDRLKHADTSEDVAEVILRAVADEEPELRYLAPAAQRQLGVK
jgi:NAD(P)-dependent dehydrogenase (short-subunit alcohol dehydrogenase family)